VLAKLDSIFKNFVRQVSIKNGLPSTLANEVGGKIFTFGSYRLGVHGKASDIDTLCVAPKHVKREDFLDDMYEALKNRPEVTKITVLFADLGRSRRIRPGNQPCIFRHSSMII
jgi:poly(A) polymerase